MLDKLRKQLYKKEDGSASMVVTFIAMFAIIFIIITGFMLSSAQLMTHQHEIDDALADSCLASLVVDHEYYYNTGETTGTYVARLANVNNSYSLYKECFETAIANGYDGFFKNIAYTTTIFYEVEGSDITITTFSDNGARSVTHGSVGNVYTPGGGYVNKTSCYAKVDFDISTFFVTEITERKSRDIYCTIKIDR